MARAARGNRIKAARLGLLTLGLAGCAQVGEPPGGPPDFTAPDLLGTIPDSGAVEPGLNWIRFQFDEVISERSGGGLERLFTISPRPRAVDVDWDRKTIKVRPDGGWRDSVAYRVTLLPGITDLRNNRLDRGRTVMVSTGGAIPATVVSGRLVDWEAGRLAAAPLIEAVRLSDSLVFYAVGDSAGGFRLTAIPRGAYTLYAVVDDNGNGLRDRNEKFDSTVISLDSAFSTDFWAFRHDTIGPRLTSAETVDSITVQVDYNLPLAPGPLNQGSITVLSLPDSVLQPVGRILLPPAYDSLVAEQRAAADSAAADSLPLDSLPVDSLAADTVVADTLVAEADTVATDSSDTRELLSRRPPLHSRLYIRMQSPLTPGGRYVINSTQTNVSGATTDSRTALLVPEPPVPAATPTPADSLAAPPDSAVVPPDSVAEPADSADARPRPDRSRAMPTRFLDD